MGDRERFIDELRKAWRDEKSSALTYAAAAEHEKDPKRRDVFRRMAAEEVKHAERWEKRLRELGVDPGTYTETVSEIARRKALVEKGPEAVVKVMEAAEDSANGGYETLAALSPTEEDRIAFEETGVMERAHDKVLTDMGALAPQAPQPMRVLQGILGKERHVSGGGWIGQAIYGINDGLGAALASSAAFAGATHVNSSFVLLSGFASMVASALSMGSGAYLADGCRRKSMRRR